MKEVQVDGENICVANVEGKYYAIGSYGKPLKH
jgi:glycine betaine catabolism B